MRSQSSSASATRSPELERRRPEPLTADERQALGRPARDVPRLGDAETTTPRDRKELLRTLVGEVIVTIRDQPRRADVQIAWEAKRTPQDTVELIRALAAPHPDRQLGAILNKQGRRTGTSICQELWMRR